MVCLSIEFQDGNRNCAHFAKIRRSIGRIRTFHRHQYHHFFSQPVLQIRRRPCSSTSLDTHTPRFPLLPAPTTLASDPAARLSASARGGVSSPRSRHGYGREDRRGLCLGHRYEFLLLRHTPPVRTPCRPRIPPNPRRIWSTRACQCCNRAS